MLKAGWSTIGGGARPDFSISGMAASRGDSMESASSIMACCGMGKGIGARGGTGMRAGTGRRGRGEGVL